MNKKLITFENMYRIASLAGLCAILYLQTHFVTVERFQEHVKDEVAYQAKVNDTLAAVNTSLTLLQSSSHVLQDHETRIRLLERVMRTP